MGFKIDHTEKDNNAFEVFLKASLQKEEAERKMLKEGGEQSKRCCRLLTSTEGLLAKSTKVAQAMADDVKVSTGKTEILAKEGQGGNGRTLWHLVMMGICTPSAYSFYGQCFEVAGRY